MPVFINGSTGVSGVDGTAATPAVQGTDTNTGMFFPAADQIAFAEGGTEVMRIDASGNVGIGTSSPSARLQAFGTSGTAQSRFGTANGYVEVTAFDANPVYCVINGASHTAGVFGTQSNTPAIFFANNTEQGRFTTAGLFQFNSGYGSVATAFGCRAWVNFNGTGTVAIRASGNVSSITDNGTGDYTVNFTNAMPDANYAVAGVAQETTAVGAVNRFLSVDTTAAGNVRVYTSLSSLFDVEGVHVAIFR